MQNARFSPDCSGGFAPVINLTDGNNLTAANSLEPFYTSTSPQIFALAVATVVSYFLVIILFITPGTFFVGGPGGGGGFLGRRGMTSGSYGSSSVVGVGRRPWLQKIATITVAVSLTIATADTFKVAEKQYYLGYRDSGKIVDQVAAGLEIRVVRVVSDAFLWLAQVQTLIHLFPRHKEKVTIKWLGFALITFDTIFSILNNFVYQRVNRRPRSFQDAIPALSYLFELAIGFIYALCIIYYALSKRRFAFWNPKMRNICLVALLSLTAVLIPVVFFVLDVSRPDVAGWGDYIRWVGAAAASVVVWEWVERIEALERDERKDGILGREIFDGDEMLEATPSEEVDCPGRRQNGRGNPEDASGGLSSSHRHVQANTSRRLRSRIPVHGRGHDATNRVQTDSMLGSSGALSSNLLRPTVPPAAVTPVSRADTTSAASTVYAIHYHPVTSESPLASENPKCLDIVIPKEMSDAPTTVLHHSDVDRAEHELVPCAEVNDNQQATDLRLRQQTRFLWRAVANPFKRRIETPPAEVAGARLDEGRSSQSPSTAGEGTWSIITGLGAFTSSQCRRMKVSANGPEVGTPMTITVIPAQRRGHNNAEPGDEEAAELDVGGKHNQNVVHRDMSSVPEIHQTSLPITVIPPPSRGQRWTWSPQDTPGRSGQNPPISVRQDSSSVLQVSRAPEGSRSESPPSSQKVDGQSLRLGRELQPQLERQHTTDSTSFLGRGTMIHSGDGSRSRAPPEDASRQSHQSNHTPPPPLPTCSEPSERAISSASLESPPNRDDQTLPPTCNEAA